MPIELTKFYDWFGLNFFSTAWTKPFYDIINAFQFEAFRQVNNRNVNTFKTKSAFATFTKEMSVLIFYAAIAVVATNIILQTPATVINNMYEAM